MASLKFLNLGAHFGHTAVARIGFAKYFQRLSEVEGKQAQTLIEYMNKRGAKVLKVNPDSPSKDSWDSAQEGIEDAIEWEKDIHNKLYASHEMAMDYKDPQMGEFLRSKFLEEEITLIHELSRIRTVLVNFETGNKALGEYFVDRMLLDEDDQKSHYFSL
jgi:ferritin heavy chain